jgi:hypothetical protein
MNWLFGLIGAVVGGVIADERVALGLVFGFCIAYLLSAAIRQGRRIDRLEDEVAALNRAAPAAGAAMPPPMPRQPAPEPVPSPAPSPLPLAAREAAPGAAVFEAREPTHVDAMVAASEARAASAQEGASEAATAARTPPMPPRPPGMPPRPPRPPAQPDWFDRAGGAIKSWFTEGNVPVKIGILVLLFGVAAALRYAAAEG